MTTAPLGGSWLPAAAMARTSNGCRAGLRGVRFIEDVIASSES